MKIAPEYSIVNLLDWIRIWIILFLTLLLSYCFLTTAKADEDLPGRMGYINEYGGLMSGREQEQIEERLASIEKRWGVEIVILVTIRDPYRNPQYFAHKIMENWELDSRKAFFLLFVKEDDQWYWERLFGSYLSGLVNLSYLDSQLDKMDKYVKRGEIVVVINRSINLLSKLMEGNLKTGETNRRPFNKKILFYLLFAILGTVILVILFRKLKSRLCSRCFRWLRVRESTPFGRGITGGVNHIIYYCPRCGYKRIERKDKS